jgi:CRISPR-associated endoribonuclease Cas6
VTLPETPFMSRYEYVLSGNPALTCSDAPRLYAWLLEQLAEPDAERIHEGEGKLLTQHVRSERGTGRIIWSVSIFSEEANEMLLPVLEENMTLALHPESVDAALAGKEIFTSPEDFIRHARRRPVDRLTELSLLSPLSFHSAGQYVIFPEKHLLLQSLVKKWNASFTGYPLEDEDALTMLENGILIRDYRLHTVRFALKGNKIPGCLGKLYLQSRLPEPLFEIWNLLLWYGTFSGAGIKTTLGMGALDCAALRE